MSMSNLGDQLAALSSTTNKSTTAGFTTSTSRDKTQSIGRGFHHSSLHGHSLGIINSNNVKEKVSLLYDTAREAAAVNLIDLREGAIAALDVLSVAAAEAYENDTTTTTTTAALVRMWKSPEFMGGLFSQQNLSYERGMATSQQNQEVDESIEKMLRLIGTMVMEIPPKELAQGGDDDDDSGGDNNNPIVLACLQIIEYLLRRYDIHARPNTASMLLQTFLPLQVCYPTSTTAAIFSRIVALIDLQTVPTWTFLRPLAARGAPPLSRVGLAKRVAKDDALVSVIVNIGKVGRDVCVVEAEEMRNEMMVDDGENDGRGGGGGAYVVRRGISTLISFSASILVEALYHQSKSQEGGVKSGGAITPGVQESMVRKILPLVLGALKSGGGNSGDDDVAMYYCPEWKEWGRLLASTLALLSPLNDTVKEALCNSTAEGMPISSLVGGKKLSFGELSEKSSSLSADEIDDATSAIMTLITIMDSSAVIDKKAKDDDDDWDHYLPMLPPSKNRRSNIVDYLGVDIASSTYKILSKNSSSISVAIGTIIDSIYGGIDEEDGGDSSDHDILDRMAPFVASLVMHAFQRIEKEGKKALMADGGKKNKKADDKFKADRDVILLLRLIKTPSLARLWNFNQSMLIAAVSVHLVKTFNELHQGLSEKSSSNILTERYKSILKALSDVNASVRDQGVAYAINTTPEGKRQESRLALLLERDATSFQVSKSSSKKDGLVEEVDNAVSSLLPLRVALEHGDSKIRLDAVVRLNEQIYNESSDGNVDIDAEMGQALLRRLCTEDDPEVAVAAGEILLSQLRVLKGNEDGMDVDEPPLLLASLLDDLESLANKALSALLHWTFIGTDTTWSPLSSLEAFKQGRKSEQNSIVLESPLSSCIGICGVVAKLIGDEINVESGMDAQDDDLDQLTQLYCKLFLAVGAHINGMTATDNDDSDLTTKISEVASEELLSFAKDDSSASVEDFITSNHIAEYVLEQCYSKKSFDAPALLQNRFVWLALHAHSDLHEKLSSRIDAAYRVIDLIVYQMNSYTNESKKSESFEMEARFLLQNCDNYLPVLKSEDLDGFGNAIMKLASSPSTVFVDAISKPAISSQLTADASKTNAAPDLVRLIHACLRPEASKDGIVHILSTAKAALEGGKVSNEVAIDCIVPALALLSHHVREVREGLLDMLESIKLANKDEKVSLIYDKVTDKSSPLRSSLLMDGVGTLPQALSQIVLAYAQPADLQSFLIKQCKSCALSEDNEIIDGGCQAAAVILSAMERSGERVFPLAKRWEFGGKDLFQSFLSLNADEFVVNASICRLRDCVATMLKGVLVNTMQVEGDGMSIQISVGPSSTGRRSRSYSIGASDSFSVLDPYPESMLQAILEALDSNSSPLMLSDSVIKQAVGRQSWINGVFPKLDSKSRHAVAAALLNLRTQHENEIAGAALLSLPMTAADLFHLLDNVDVSQSEDGQAAVVFITDCVREKSDLGKVSDISKLSSKLFDQLLALSATESNEGDSGGRDYTRVSILQTLLGIHQQYKSQISDLSADDGKKRKKRSRSHSDVGSTKSLATQANMLVGIVGGNPSTINPLNSGRGRSLALSLLTCLCEESPSTVSSSLLPALMSIAGKHSSNDRGEQARDTVDSRVLADALAAIIPAYCANSQSTDLSLFKLIESFVGKVIVPENGNGKLRTHLIDPFVNALKLLPTKEDSIEAIASLAASVLALQAFDLNNEMETTDDEEDANSAKLNCHVLATSPSGIKIPTSLLLLKYAEQLMSVICGASSFSANDSSSNLKASMSEVASLALRGSNVGEDIPSSYSECNESQQRSILYLAICLLEMVRDVTGTNAVKRLLRKSQGDDADVSLRLWQELLQAHMHALRAHAKLAGEGALRRKERKFWTAVPIAISECLENIQGLLPVPHFLASVSSTLADESTDAYMRKKTVRLLADRVAEVSLESAEASLFLEMVPELVAQVGVAQPRVSSDDEEAVAALKRNIIMQQGALVALESFVRSLCPASEKSKLTSKAADAFVPALQSVTKLFSGTAASWSRESDEDDVEMLGIKDAECQLLSSSTLCLASLVAVLKARCLPLLPSIVKPLIASLKSINLLAEGTQFPAESSESMLQLAILRLLEALAENLPQFLPPYLPLIFSNNALPSKALRRGDHSLKEATERVESALASKTPIRQLTPALSKALSNTLVNSDDSDSSDWEEACSILGVINASVGTSERSELPPVIGKIFNVLVAAYSYEGGDECKSRLLSDANKVLLSLVMKLSESQLRQLYARLREWRGDIKEEDDDDSNQSSSRRVAFWTLSAALSKSLRSIFLPCLTSVLTDVIDELEIAVSLLCQRPKHDGSKRRRVDEDSDSDSSVDDNSEVSPLQPLLLCLESALKADAHEGGNWTRGDDNQRYNMILSHLGKLLMAHVPKDLPVSSDLSQKENAATSSYQKLVEGQGTLEHGNVAGCLTALATAAGNEQLWKPLNFAVLEACSHKRSEVRRAGISCLLSIIETVGEEYMVLLPECLPVLSELLEDGDEEIAGMAKECVRQGEELLGESLEDSLR